VLHSTGAHAVREDVEEATSRVRALLAQVGLSSEAHVTTVMTPDPPAQALVFHARDAELLVMGTRGSLALARLALGSVSREVLDGVTRPLLLVPRH
jgi:nucleotide-binding universal stress UspA family protein